METNSHNPDSQVLSRLIDRFISRRQVLKFAGKSAVLPLAISGLTGTLAGCDSADSDSGSSSSSGSSEIPASSTEYSVLKRTSFGVEREAMQEIETLGIDAYLEQQLNYETIDDGDLEATIAGLFPLISQTANDLLGGFPDNIGTVAIQMISATQYRQFYSKRQLYEVMVEFWSDHFNIQLINGLGPTLKPIDDIDVIRANALGNFGDMLHASAKSPSMLFYLDNYLNRAGDPNENYAREVMELHTLGVDGGYTENDIKEVARCFTGWTLQFPPVSPTYGLFVFDQANHDYGEKLVLGETIPGGRSGVDGQLDGEEVLGILIRHPSTASFIATKLCQRFISDTPSEITVNEVAQAFSDSFGDIKTTLRALFATVEFNETQDQKFTRPSEYLGQVVRSLGAGNYPSDSGQLFYFAQSILGQLPFFWPTPDGYPDEQSYWASTGGLLNRWRLSFLSFAAVIPEIDVFNIDLASILGGANTLNTVVDAVVENMLMRDLSERDRNLIVDGLAAGLGISPDQEGSAEDAEGIAAYVAAVLISSVYLQLR